MKSYLFMRYLYLTLLIIRKSTNILQVILQKEVISQKSTLQVAILYRVSFNA